MSTKSQLALLLIAFAGVFGTSQAIQCYSRSLSSSSISNGSSLTCASSVSSCYSYVYTSGSSVYHYGGCGTCSTSSYPSCYTCTTDHCNSVSPSSISCYTRTVFTSGNGTMTACPTGITTCYNYTSGSTNYAGCGNCMAYSSSQCSSSSAMCSTNYCNHEPTPINCFYSFGSFHYSQRVRTTCSSTSCYEYSYGFASTNYFFAGCGTCSLFSLYSNCRSCTTEYCNSAPKPAFMQASLVMTTAGAAVALMITAAVKNF